MLQLLTPQTPCSPWARTGGHRCRRRPTGTHPGSGTALSQAGHQCRRVPCGQRHGTWFRTEPGPIGPF